jgi:hypothetical protein
MHTEHLQNVSVGSMIGGWLVAIAVTSLVVRVFEASGFDASGGVVTSVATLLAVAVGFATGGFFTGFRTRRAPVLHGAGIGIVSIVAWATVGVVSAALGQSYDAGLTPALTVGAIFFMIAAAALGALVGYNLALRGRPGLSEEFPGDGP